MHTLTLESQRGKLHLSFAVGVGGNVMNLINEGEES